MTMKRTLIAALMAAAVTPAMAQDGGLNKGIGASNFSYNTVGFDLGRATPDDSIFLAGEEYDNFGVVALSGSAQVADNLALGAGFAVITNEGDRSEITETAVTFGIEIPIPVGQQVDIVPKIGFARSEFEVCVDGTCDSDDDSFAVYGATVRAWVVPEAFEVSGGFTDSGQEDSDAVLELGVAGWFNEHHSVRLDYATNDYLSVTTVGYRYTW